jgi:hypothetical protein
VAGPYFSTVSKTERSQTVNIQQKEKTNLLSKLVWQSNIEVEEDAEDIDTDSDFLPFVLTPLFTYQFQSGNLPYFSTNLNSWKLFPSAIKLFLLFENLRN